MNSLVVLLLISQHIYALTSCSVTDRHLVFSYFFLSAGDSYRILTQISYTPTGLRRLSADWTRWPLNLILSALYIQYVENKGLHRRLLWRPVHLPVPCTLELATLSLCFRADFAHFPPTEPDVSPLLHSDVFLLHVTNKWNSRKVHLPQRTINLYPIYYISNPLQRMWCLHLP